MATVTTVLVANRPKVQSDLFASVGNPELNFLFTSRKGGNTWGYLTYTVELLSNCHGTLLSYHRAPL